MPGKGQDQLSIMHCFRGGFIAALSFIFVHARSQDLYSFDSSAPNLNDPASDDLFLDSPELYDFSSDDTADPLNEDSTTGSWDLASLPSCDAQSSLTDDFLQARDGNSCPTREQDGSLDLPTGLFQDPLQLWDNGLKTPPVGQNNQPDVGSKDGDFDFRAFVNSRPKSILNYPDDEKTCPPEIYGLSITPVCHYPDRGSSVSVGGLTLHDVTPCRCLILAFHYPNNLTAIADSPE